MSELDGAARLVSGVALLLWSTLAVAADVPVELRVLDHGGAPHLVREELERALRVELARLPCNPAPAPGARPHQLEVLIELLRWQEERTPGGAPIIDRQTGVARPGEAFNVSARARVLVLQRGQSEPRCDRQTQASARQATTGNPLQNPRDQARRQVFDRLSRFVRKLLCREVKLLRADRSRTKGSR